MKPTFIGIGAQKCASSWLYRVLADHPQVGVAEPKEIDFFSYRYDHGYCWYERHFDCLKSRHAVGENSPSYFSDPLAPSRIYGYAPSARILVSLRDPIARALSNHRHEVRLGRVPQTDLSFEAGLRNNPMYIEQGLYATHISRWLEYFPMEQILVVLMEDIERNPWEVARALYSFVGVEESYRPRVLGSRINASYANRSLKLAMVKDSIYRQVNRSGLACLWSLGTVLGAKAVYRRLNVLSSDRVIPDPSARTIDELRALYVPEVERLSKLIGRNLDDWMGRA